MTQSRNYQRVTSRAGWAFFAAAFVMVPAAPIFAQTPSIFDGCIEALEAGNLQEALRISERIKRFSPVVNEIDQQVGAECITRSTGIETTYSPVYQRFLSDEELAAMVGANEAAHAEAEAALQEALAAEAALQEALAAETAADIARRQRAAAALSLAFAQEGARRATMNACKELYSSSETDALLNSVCSPIFLELGLPEDW